MNPPHTGPELVLASASAARRDLMTRLQRPFNVDPADIDEQARHDELPREVAVRLAREKARAVAHRHSDAVIIGSDQVAELNGTRLGKPGSFEKAAAQLQACSGNRVTFWTAVCVIDTRHGREKQFLDETVVRFRTLATDEIERYLKRDEPYDSAGSFRAESLGIALFEEIESADPTSLIGLPLITLAATLRDFGLPVL